MEARSEAGRLIRVVWSRPARNDIFSIADYYDAIDPDLAEAIVDRIRNAADPLVDNPRIGAVASGSTRRWNVRDTPFQLLYTLNGDDLEIRRVRHLRQNWQIV